MNAGQMRNIIELLMPNHPNSPYRSTDIDNKSYDIVAKLYAKKEDKLSPSFWGAMAENALHSKQFIIRYRNDITEKLCLRHNNEIYKIKAMAELGNNRQWLVILAERIDYVGI